MKYYQKVWNNKAKKVAYFMRRDAEYTVVKIDGLNTHVKNEDFDTYYEKVLEK